MSRSWRLFIDDILDCAEKIVRYTKGMSFEAFAANELTRDAVLHNLEIIGEASKKIPEEVRRQHPEIDWKGMARLRDVLAHAYFLVNQSTIWDLVSREVPLLREQLRKLSDR